MEYTQEKINEIIEEQRQYFKTNETLDVNFRISALKKLKEAINFYTEDMKIALYKDIKRSSTEAYLLDIGPALQEVNEAIKKVKKWAKTEIHYSGIISFPSLITRVYKMPYGVTLIVSPSNFPYELTIAPLAAALAAGNTAIIRPSSNTPNCNEVLKKIVERSFLDKYVTVIECNHEVGDMLLSAKFDKIFYTGSPAVGKHVLELASKNLVPCALELGGETGNWCIVRKDADLKDAARKIAFFKICNSGRICININQVAIAEEVSDKFIELLKQEFNRQIGLDAANNEEYCCFADKKNFDKCIKEVEKYKDKVIYGGSYNTEQLKHSPTILYPIDINDDVVQHELFNPILPIVKFKDNEIDDLIKTINNREKGLAFYVFTKDMRWANKVMSTSQFGGGCINEVVMHIMAKGVPFNGVGHSGMGAYHGEWGFREFSHPCTVLTGCNKFNLSLREHPYNGKENSWKDKLINLIEK